MFAISGIGAAIIGPLKDLILGHIGATKLQEREWDRENKAEIYGPLLKEFEDNLDLMNNFSLIECKQWGRLNSGERRLSLRMNKKIRENVEAFCETQLKDYTAGYNAAAKVVRDVVYIEVDARWDHGYNWDIAPYFFDCLTPLLFAGELTNNRRSLAQELNNINSYLSRKYADLDSFFKEILYIVDKKQKVIDLRANNKKMAEQMKAIIELLKKRVE